MSLTQYLKDTRAELRHVAWPTQPQTIIYTALVAAISIGVAVYLGFFDFVFTGALGHLVNTYSGASAAQQQQLPQASTTGNGLTITPLSTSTQK